MNRNDTLVYFETVIRPATEKLITGCDSLQEHVCAGLQEAMLHVATSDGTKTLPEVKE